MNKLKKILFSCISGIISIIYNNADAAYYTYVDGYVVTFTKGSSCTQGTYDCSPSITTTSTDTNLCNTYGYYYSGSSCTKCNPAGTTTTKPYTTTTTYTIGKVCCHDNSTSNQTSSYIWTPSSASGGTFSNGKLTIKSGAKGPTSQSDCCSYSGSDTRGKYEYGSCCYYN